MKTLSEYLKDSDITQIQFAGTTGLTQGSVSKLCGKDPKISIETALLIERVTKGAVQVEVWPQFKALTNRLKPLIKNKSDDRDPKFQDVAE